MIDKDEWCFPVMKPIPFGDEIETHRNLVQQHKDGIRKIRLQNAPEKLESENVIE